MNDALRLEDEYTLGGYDKFPFALERGEGCWVWDERGRKYLDLYGGHAVCALGHSPEEVAAAVSRQSRKLLFYSSLAYSRVRAEAAKALVELCGEKGSKVFFCNSGAEANENAFRVARSATGRPKIVATLGSFHGRTAAALAATGIEKYRKGVAGLGADIVHVPFGSLEAAAAELGPDAAAFVLEPIQSMGGAIVPPDGYLKGLEALCRERGAMLIFDEIQTGLGRVGAPSAARLFGVRPHLQTFAKALASGVPAAALLAGPEAASALKPGALGSTFGGGPLACAAIQATLEVLSRRRLWENAAAMERFLRAELAGVPGLKAMQGRGLLLGLVLDRPSKPVRAALLERGILVGGADDPNVIRLLPPLTVGEAELRPLKDALLSCTSLT